MKDKDYFRAKSLLENIDSLTKSTDEFKEMQKSVKEHGAEAKIFLRTNGKSHEIIPSRKIIELMLSKSIKQCNNSIMELKDAINKTIDNALADSSDRNEKEGNKGNMERLTIEYCGEYVPKELCSIDRLGNADDCDLCCEYCKATKEDGVDCRGCAINQCFNKLGEYEELEDKGKLLKLPCVVGSEIWYIDVYGDTDTEIVRGVVDGYLWYRSCGFALNVVWDKPIMGQLGYKRKEMPFSEVGKTIFLTKPEAEAALKKLETKK